MEMERLISRVSRAFLVVVIVTSVVVTAVPSTAEGAGGDALRSGDEAAAVWTDRSVVDERRGRLTGGLSGADSDAEMQSDPPVINATYAFERNPDPGVVTVRVTYDVPESITGLEVNPAARNVSRVTITDATGFVEGPEGDRWRWEEDESTVEAPSVRMRYAVNESSDVFDGLNYVDTGAWALLDPPRPVLSSYRSSGAEAAFDRTTAIADGESGYATPGMVCLGQYGQTNGTEQGQEFVVVTPAAATRVNTSAVLDTLGAANRLYDVPGRDEQVVVFAAPSPLREGGVRASADGVNRSRVDSIWVSSDSPADSSTYVHEYIHTRQAFETTGRMSWIVEAQASYYDELLPLYRGTITYREFHAEVSTAENATRRLAPENRTADALIADYSKGARVLAALDAKIRTASGRTGSLADVFRRMNRHDGRVSYADFKGIVAAVSGRQFDGWLDRHLTTTDAPAVPRNQSLHAPVQLGVDSDDDGLDTAAELDNGTEPFAADTDGDGFDDGEELRRGTDPLSFADYPGQAEPTPEPTPGAGGSERTAPGDTPGSGTSDGGEMGADVAFGLIGSLLATGVFGVGAIGIGAAKLLNRWTRVKIGFLTRRSVWSVIGLSVLSIIAFAAFMLLLFFTAFVGMAN